MSALSEEEHITGFHCVGFLFNLNTETKRTDFFLILPAFSTMGMMFSVGSRTLNSLHLSSSGDCCFSFLSVSFTACILQSNSEISKDL